MVRDGRIFVRTIAGLKRADVLWRHVDADWCRSASNSMPSRGSACRACSTRCAAAASSSRNMPGSGLVESRALMAFMPAPVARAARRRLCGCRTSRPGGAGRRSERDARAGLARRRWRSPAPSATTSPGFAQARQRHRRRSRAGRIARDSSAAIERARRRLCRAGGRAAFDDAAAGTTASSCRAPSCCASMRRRRRMAGASCPAASAASPTAADARAVSMGDGVRSRPTSGCSATSPSR